MATEKRLIDANALVKDLELLAKFECNYLQSVVLGIIYTIKQRHTVDAVEVVRCKDCECAEPCYDDIIKCKYGQYHSTNWYCLAGKRKAI